MISILLVLHLSLMGPSVGTNAATASCSFEHPNYQGTCVETVSPEPDQTALQACRVVLACLNDTRCVKTYCKATTIRGGWTLVSAEAAASDAAGRR